MVVKMLGRKLEISCMCERSQESKASVAAEKKPRILHHKVLLRPQNFTEGLASCSPFQSKVSQENPLYSAPNGLSILITLGNTTCPSRKAPK